LTYAVEERRGFVQLTGEIGTGKTMILDALVLGLDARTKVARLSHTTISEDELFELLVREFGLEHRGGGKLERLSEIQEFLDEWTAAGRNSVLVVDEAQNLSLPVLEEIRLLSNLRSQGKCSLQIVLAGQPEFRVRLDQEDLRQLKQRIGIRYHLTPLSAGETGEYVAHRMNVAGATGSTIFDRGAVDAIFAYAGGVPRMINIICDRALVAGYGANRRRIGKALILETVEDIEGVEFGAARVAASDEAFPVRVGKVADAPPSRPVLAPTPGAVQEAARIAPNATEAAPQASDPARPRERTPSRALPVRRRVGVVGASVKSRVLPMWVLPALLVVVALAAVVFSAIGTGWWQTLVDQRDGGSPTAPLADLGGSADAGGTGAGENSDTGGRSRGSGVVSGMVETGVEEASAGETNLITGAATEDAGGDEIEEDDEPAGGDEADDGGATARVESEFASSGQKPPATSGPGGPYRAIVLSSRSANSASGEASRLAERGFLVEVIPVDIGDGGLWHRVVVRGGYPALDSAREVVDELRRLGYESAWVHKE
jgi:general secretion pathway protein A